VKTGTVLLLLFLVGFNPTWPAAGQIMVEKPSPQRILREWADPATVEKWTRAIHEGRLAFAENRLDAAAAFFHQAILACDGKAPESIHQCLARLLLTETSLESGRTEDATVQVNQLVKNLKKATRYKNSGDSNPLNRLFADMTTNAYRYQVGGALYLRAARIYARLGDFRSAEPLFRDAVRMFGQTTHKGALVLIGEGGSLRGGSPVYPRRHLRIAEIHEAQCRFHLMRGMNDQALKSLQEAENVRKNPPLDSNGNPIREVEPFLDQLVAEPLDKSFLKRFLEDCAFYRFDDARIADLLVRQAALLKKVGRTDEATAFERFAESLRKKPLPR
jgi:tetratricopeptide (TPR) repeat protein